MQSKTPVLRGATSSLLSWFDVLSSKVFLTWPAEQTTTSDTSRSTPPPSPATPIQCCKVLWALGFIYLVETFLQHCLAGEGGDTIVRTVFQQRESNTFSPDTELQGVTKREKKSASGASRAYPLPVSSLVLALCFLRSFPDQRACSRATGFSAPMLPSLNACLKSFGRNVFTTFLLEEGAGLHYCTPCASTKEHWS